MTISTLAKPTLPTLDRLQAVVPANTDARKVASTWLAGLAGLLKAYTYGEYVQPDRLDALLLADATWRDTLALTWDYRSIYGTRAIHTLLSNRASSSGIAINPSAISTEPFFSPLLSTPFPDVSWVQFGFELKTAVGEGRGFARLVPTSDGSWKAYTVWTSLESLSEFTYTVSSPIYSLIPTHVTYSINPFSLNENALRKLTGSKNEHGKQNLWVRIRRL